MMEARHIQKYIHISPRKLRLVADMVRGMNPLRALDVLAFSYKAAGEDLSKAIKTALGNAKQMGLDQNQVFFKSIEVNESMKMRRFRAGTRGRAKPYRRKMSHIKIVLSDEIVQKNSENSENQKIRKSDVSDNQKNRSTDLSGTLSNSESSEKKKEEK